MPRKPIPYPTSLQPRDLARLWSKVLKTPNCWLWQGYLSPYGRFSIGRDVTLQPHRLIYVLTYGPFDWSLEVCHNCDTPACVRPAHLFLGTEADNARDAWAKGRAAHGERHGMASLGEQQVLAIRAALRAGEATTTVARRYGVSAPLVMAIKHRRLWRNVGDATEDAAMPIGVARGEDHRAAKLSGDDVRAIRDRYAAGGISQAKLGATYGVDQALISRIVRGQRWRHLDSDVREQKRAAAPLDKIKL